MKEEKERVVQGHNRNQRNRRQSRKNVRKKERGGKKKKPGCLSIGIRETVQLRVSLKTRNEKIENWVERTWWLIHQCHEENYGGQEVVPQWYAANEFVQKEEESARGMDNKNNELTKKWIGRERVINGKIQRGGFRRHKGYRGNEKVNLKRTEGVGTPRRRKEKDKKRTVQKGGKKNEKRHRGGVGWFTKKK